MKRESMEGFRDYLARRRPWLVIVMLVLLHVALLLEHGNLLFRALMLSHLGVFLLWQPIWHGEKKLTSASAFTVALAALFFALWINWWLIVLWFALLIGLIGGLVFATQKRGPRWFYLVAELYLVGVLLVWVVPHLFPGEGVPQAARYFMQLGLPLFIVGMLMLPARDEPQQLQTIDFFYSLLVFLLMLVLVLGSFVLKVEAREDYLTALVLSLFIIALVLFGMSWLWNPRAGYAGLEQIFSRYLLSIGLPFEQWLYRLARLSESETDAGAFLRSAMAGLAEVPGIAGGRWESPDGSGCFGEVRGNQADFEWPPLSLVLYARGSFSPAMLLHFNLLVHLVGVFYQLKRREQTLEQQAYLEAVHETGARLTHDVKNLLQSLKALCSAAEHGQNGDGCSLQSLFARQLPRIAQRLEQTLEKLRQPGAAEESTWVDVVAWWEILQQRYASENLRFVLEGEASGVRLPAELFDNVADNLLQNALEKRKLEAGIGIVVSLIADEGGVLRVCDGGAPLDDAMVARLLVAPVTSRNGLGVGLYQSARFAARWGYRLALTSNLAGQVCFELRASASV